MESGHPTEQGISGVAVRAAVLARRHHNRGVLIAGGQSAAAALGGGPAPAEAARRRAARGTASGPGAKGGARSPGGRRTASTGGFGGREDPGRQRTSTNDACTRRHRRAVGGGLVRPEERGAGPRAAKGPSCPGAARAAASREGSEAGQRAGAAATPGLGEILPVATGQRGEAGADRAVQARSQGRLTAAPQAVRRQACRKAGGRKSPEGWPD